MGYKKSFLSKLGKMINVGSKKDDDEKDSEENLDNEEIEENILEDEEGQLAIDMYQTPDEIIIKTMVAGVKPEDLDVSITRDMITIRGTRRESYETNDNDFFHQELYWGSFSRTVVLPAEIDIDGAEASERHGLLVLKLPKIDKTKQSKLKIKNN